jgi:N-acyl-D-aspartate/D-glutamate deacylase
MSFDLVIKQGRVIDGTGMPTFVADVGIRGDRIARIGRIDDCDGAQVIDAEGRWVTPGFIDVHTHYDVQLDWDPLATPSCWHGVTTVLAGNCGFTLAPAKPEDVPWLAAMLSRVEGMSKEALGEGLQFGGGGFGDYWKRFDGKLGINVGSFVGHCAIRRYVMGDDASEREATADEIEAMRGLVRDAMREGAMGFSTSQISVHVGDDGREVPSNHASADEILALASVLAEFDRGAVEIIPRSFAEGYDAADRELLLGLYRVSGRPVELNILVPNPKTPMGWKKTLEFVNEAAEQGARLHPMFTTNALSLHLRLSDTFVFDEMPAWREALTRPEPDRMRMLRDPAVRERLKVEWDDSSGRAVSFEWADLYIEVVRDETNAALLDRNVAEIAEERGIDPVDAFLDVALAEDLETQFETRLSEVGKQFIEHVVRESITNPLVMPGSSDGGAHLASFVGADYTTRLLAEWVPDPLTLEHAVWRNTLVPATVHGIVDRGVLREGAFADVLVIDPERLSAGKPRLARDFPAGTERYVVDAEGYERVIVNGQVLLEEGKHSGAFPGAVLRGV